MSKNFFIFVLKYAYSDLLGQSIRGVPAFALSVFLFLSYLSLTMCYHTYCRV